MFFVDFVVFAAQILAFAICFSLILRVGAVQANTLLSNVWNSHEKTNNLKFQKAGFSRNHNDFLVFWTPNLQIWAQHRRFAALAKRNHQKTANLQPWLSEIVPKPSRDYLGTKPTPFKRILIEIVDSLILGRSRPGPALDIDAFLNCFIQKPLTFRSLAALHPARRSKSMLF